ncbi:MAG: hypothetical protein WCE35_15570 [Bradyrhizobium sp.]
MLGYAFCCVAAQLVGGAAFASSEGVMACDGLAATWMSARPEAPAAIFVPGQGPITRNGDQAGLIHSTALFLATDLLKAEMSALIFDKRGIGASGIGSGKPWDESTMIEEANDIRCLVRWVIENKQPSSVTLIGYNDGNIVAAMAATAGVDGIVMLPVFEGSASDMADDLRRGGLAEPAVAEIERAVASRLRGETATYSFPTLHRVVATIVKRIRSMRPPFDQIDVVARLDMPVLLVGAGRDFETSRTKFKRLAEAAPGASIFYEPNMSGFLRTYAADCPDSCQRKRLPSSDPLDPGAVAAISSFVACGKVGTNATSCHANSPAQSARVDD